MNKEQELYKQVEKVSLKDVFQEHNFPPGFTHGVIDENNNILNFCSAKYNLVPNEFIFKPIEQHLQEIGLKYDKRIQIINKAKFYVDYIIKNKCKSPSINDVFPKLIVWNSYDGTTKFRTEFGYHKLICSNGLSSPLINLSKSYYKHVNAVGVDMDSVEDFTLDFIQSSLDFLSSSKKDIEIFEEMNDVPSKIKDLKIIAKELKYSKMVQNVAEERFVLEIGGGAAYYNENGDATIDDGCNPTMFTVYNALNYSIYNTQFKELPEKKLEKELLLSKTIREYL